MLLPVNYHQIQKVLAHKTDIKAQVKLKFHNVNGTELVVTRSLLVSQKASKMTQRTLESLLLLRDPDSGEQYSLTSRCAEIDTELPIHLGVSKAILENVIFCHQEDSFWPLSEPRYTKALDNIKHIRKKQAIDIKVDQTQLESDRIDKERAAKLRVELSKTETSIEKGQERINELDGQNGLIHNLENELNSVIERRQEISQLRNRIDQFQLEREMILKNIETLSTNLTILPHTDEDLEKVMKQHHNSIHTQISDQKRLEERKVEITKQEDDLRRQVSEQYTIRGQYQAEKNSQLQRLQDRKKLIIEIILKHKFDEFDVNNFQENDTQRFINRLQVELKTKDNEMKSAKDVFKKKENELIESLQSLKSNLSGCEESQLMIRQQMESLKTKIEDANKKSQTLSSTTSELEELKANIAEEEALLENLQDGLKNLDKDSGISALNNTLQGYERDAQKLRDEMSILNLQGDTRARLSLKKSDKDRKQNSLNRIEKETHLSDVREDYQKELAQSSTIDAKLLLVRQSFQAKSGELETKLNNIRKVCEGKEYPSALATAESECEHYKSNVATMKSAGGMYTKFIAKFKESKCCPLCARSFPDTVAETEFQGKLDTVLARVPDATKKADAELEKWTKTLNALKELRSAWDDCERLSNIELTELRKQRDQYEKEKAIAKKKLDDLKSDISIIEIEVTQIQSSKIRAQEFLRMLREIEQLDKDIEVINRDLSLSGNLKTIEEVQNEYEEIQLKCKQIRTKIDLSNTQSRMKQQGVNQQERKVRDLKDRYQILDFQLKDIENIGLQISGYQRDMQRLQKQKNDIDARSADLPQQILLTSNQLKDLQLDGSTQEGILLKQYQFVSNSVNQINSIERDIQRYIEDRKDNQYDDCVNMTTKLESTLKTLQNELSQIVTNLEYLSKQTSEIQVMLRNIDDNMKIRKYKKDELQLQEQITSLKSKLITLDQRSAMLHYDTLKDQYDNYIAERSELIGKLKQLEEQMKIQSRQLNSDYKDIDHRAIMSFHAVKMAEINKIIRELWEKTYRGQDIDVIESNSYLLTHAVRSDPDAEGGTGARRSYNYRVVMVRGDVEMDLRGRCSAGQRVLASIIIRLALAETFCLNCGILALDEPTTNLDTENIESLANGLVRYCILQELTLASIIKDRSAQKNFQLIIITHDEEFMHSIGKSDFADHYWRVEKDIQ
ncbi:DNA repair protein rad50 [Globomyces sp. JEL0801]|nr:DNA repair protein rad50 [Globomyces sp. JEL0801]